MLTARGSWLSPSVGPSTPDDLSQCEAARWAAGRQALGGRYLPAAMTSDDQCMPCNPTHVQCRQEPPGRKPFCSGKSLGEAGAPGGSFGGEVDPLRATRLFGEALSFLPWAHSPC
jgi:hypothetical protein